MNAAESIAAAPEASAPAAPEAQAPVAVPAAPAAIEQPAATAPSAPAQPPVPALTPEQDVAKKQLELRAQTEALVKRREDECAAELAKVCEKYGCELIVGHSVKVLFKGQTQK